MRPFALLASLAAVVLVNLSSGELFYQKIASASARGADDIKVAARDTNDCNAQWEECNRAYQRAEADQEGSGRRIPYDCQEKVCIIFFPAKCLFHSNTHFKIIAW
jgi:hypothetical protein